MLLNLDIGNTNIKSALFDDDSLIEFLIYPDVDKALDYLKNKTFTEAAICSVNPSREKILSTLIYSEGIRLFKASIHHKSNLKLNYKTPDTLGMDRICSAAGAYDFVLKNNIKLKDRYILTIDFGTATTINIVSPENNFIGGLIAPGIRTMMKSLNKETAQLPIPELDSFEGFIGDSTNASIISGVVTATIGMINETVYHLKEVSSGTEPVIFATGGNAKIIMPKLKHKIFYDEALVLKGLKLIYEMNR